MEIIRFEQLTELARKVVDVMVSDTRFVNEVRPKLGRRSDVTAVVLETTTRLNGIRAEESKAEVKLHLDVVTNHIIETLSH